MFRIGNHFVSKSISLLLAFEFILLLTTSRKSWCRCRTAAAASRSRNCSSASCSGVKVTDAATFFERETCQIRVDSLQPSWLVFGGGFDQSFVRTFMKRTFDLCAACSSWLDDAADAADRAGHLAGRPRPGVLPQERVGKDGKTFMVHKVPQHAHRRRKGRQAAVGRSRTTRASPASATSSARPASTSCRRSSTCSRAR
jgi:hypothetical protein